MKILFIFLDGIGLGADNPETNPLARAKMPFLGSLLGGRKLTASAASFQSEQVSLLALDAGLGVTGLPQSATGQAMLLSGVNIPAELGYHYGPKPNPGVAGYLSNGNTLFSWLHANGKKAALLNAYPPRYFSGIESGKRLYSSIPLAYTSAGYPLFTQEDFFAGRALSADFTGHGWRSMLKITDAPIVSAQEAGEKLAELAQKYDFSMFEYWASDYAGHKQDMDWAVEQMEVFDGVLAALVKAWDMDEDLILVTSDHGNMEDLSTRRHTQASVPGLVIGGKHQRFTDGLVDLTGIAPRIRDLILDGK
ncbi:MAG: alkaline phosphatase family protein [Chloroflexi bacterium]|nr:alkaline phosphatase family protein [Chloroflexota bacterium]